MPAICRIEVLGPQQGMTAPGYDVVILEFFLQLLYIINRNNHANAFGEKHDKAVNQRISGVDNAN